MTNSLKIFRGKLETSVPLEPVRAYVAVSVEVDGSTEPTCRVVVAWESVGTEEHVRSYIAEWMEGYAAFVVELNAVLGPAVLTVEPTPGQRELFT